MLKFWPIFKRELKVYFTSPIAYAVLFIFLVLTGFFFFAIVSQYVKSSFIAARNPMVANLNYIDGLLLPMFGNISVIMLLILPILTMRLFAEEKKSGTFELLFSYPVRDVDVLLGKYLAALTMVTLMLSLTGLNLLLLLGLGVQEGGVVLTGYLGLFLQAAAFLALGVLISSLTENQIVAAAISFGALLLFWVIGWAAASASAPWNHVLEYLTLVKHMMDFAKGVIDTRHLAYYLAFIFFFLFLTLRSLESKRWRG